MEDFLKKRLVADEDFALTYAAENPNDTAEILRLVLPRITSKDLLTRAVRLAASTAEAADVRRQLAQRALDAQAVPPDELVLGLILDACGDPTVDEFATELFGRFATERRDRARAILRHPEQAIVEWSSKALLRLARRQERGDDGALGDGGSLVHGEDALDEAIDALSNARRHDFLAEVTEDRAALAERVVQRLMSKRGGDRFLKYAHLDDETNTVPIIIDEHVVSMLVRVGIDASWPTRNIVLAVRAVARLRPLELGACVARGLGKSLSAVIEALDGAEAVKVFRAEAQNPRASTQSIFSGLLALLGKTAPQSLTVSDESLNKAQGEHGTDGDDDHCTLELIQRLWRGTAVGRQIDLGLSPEFLRNYRDSLAPLAATASGALVRRFARFGSSPPPDEVTRLVERWWIEYATAEEWDALLPLVALTWGRGLKEAIAHASPAGIRWLAAAGANAMLAHHVAERSDATELWRMLAEHASRPALAAHARALAAERGAGLAPSADLGANLMVLGSINVRAGVEPTDEQVAYARAVLAAPRTDVLAHPALHEALTTLVQLAEHAKLSEGRDVWIESIVRPSVDPTTAYLLSQFPWHAHREVAQRIAANIGQLPPGRIDHIFSYDRMPLPTPLALIWARSPKTPREVRAHAAWRALQDPEFDPAKCDLSGDSGLASRLLGLRPFERTPRAREYAIRHAVREIVRTAGPADDSVAELRLGLVEHARSSDADAGTIRDELTECLWDQLRRVRYAKGRLVPGPEKVRPWVEAAGWIRDRRFEDALAHLGQMLDRDERAALGETLDLAISETRKPSRMTDVGIVKLALASLVLHS